MKKVTALFKVPLLVTMLAFVMQGCLKDTCTQTYTIYIPVYKTSEEVRANIKNSAPQQVTNPGKMFVLGSYIFLNEIDKGIHIIDNSNPASPVNKYFINIPGNIDIAVKGNTLYADLYSDLVTVDITDPASVTVKKIINDAFPFRRYANGFVADSSKIIVDWITKDTTVSCHSHLYAYPGMLHADAASSQYSNAAAVTKGISGSMARFTLMNDYLYTVTDNFINVFNIAQPHDPIFTNKVSVSWNIETIYPFKNNLFIGSSSGMFIYGTSNPEQPNQLGTFAHVQTCDPVIAEDNYAYVTLRSGSACAGFANQLDVLDIQNISSPTLVKSYPLTNPHGLSKDGSSLFICDGADGLKVFDASNVNNIKQLQTISGLDAYDVIATNNVAIVVAKNGLYQYDYSNPSNLRFLSKISIVKK